MVFGRKSMVLLKRIERCSSWTFDAIGGKSERNWGCLWWLAGRRDSSLILNLWLSLYAFTEPKSVITNVCSKKYFTLHFPLSVRQLTRDSQLHLGHSITSFDSKYSSKHFLFSQFFYILCHIVYPVSIKQSTKTHLRVNVGWPLAINRNELPRKYVKELNSTCISSSSSVIPCGIPYTPSWSTSRVIKPITCSAVRIFLSARTFSL